jgi:uncharacterized membrane protein
VEEDRGRSAERLVTFTDAVVAIAVTLLALPLADIVGEKHRSLEHLLDDATGPLIAFAISFFVIARLWWSHHRIFQHVQRWDGPLVQLTIVWLFTIVLLAPVTALTGHDNPFEGNSAGEIGIYIGTMLLSSGLLSALAWHVRRTPALTDGHDDEAALRLFTSVETTISFAIALVVGVLVPAINYFALLSLVVTGQIGRLIWQRRHPARRLNIR